MYTIKAWNQYVKKNYIPENYLGRDIYITSNSKFRLQRDIALKQLKALHGLMECGDHCVDEFTAFVEKKPGSQFILRYLSF